MFSQIEVLPFHLALFNFMCLHNMLCGSLGVIRFDIKLVVLYFFRNVLLLLILKFLAHHLGLLLIAILPCDMLGLAHFKEDVLLWALDASSLVSFSSVCLRTSNGVCMENLIIVNVYIILGIILMHFWEKRCILCHHLHVFCRFTLGYGFFPCFAACWTILPKIWL